MNVNVTFICSSGVKQTMKNRATELGDGPDTFSVPLSTKSDETDRTKATHWAMSGWVPQEYVDAFSNEPGVKLEVMAEGDTFDSHLAKQSPRLYRVIEGI